MQGHLRRLRLCQVIPFMTNLLAAGSRTSKTGCRCSCQCATAAGVRPADRLANSASED